MPAFKRLDDGDEWMLAEDIPNIDFFFCQIWLHSFVNNLRHSCGMNYSKVLGVFRGLDMSFYYGKKNCLEFTRSLVQKLGANPAFGDRINRNIRRFSDELEESSKRIPEDLSAKTNRELWKILDEHVKIHTKLYEWGWLSNATDMFYPEFTELLKNYLRRKTRSEEEVNNWFVTLTTPDDKSRELLQHEDFLRLAIEIENDEYHRGLFTHETPARIHKGLRGAVKNSFEKYYAAYAPISALWVGRPAPPEHFISELSNYLKQGKAPAEELERIEAELNAKAAAKKQLFKKLKIDEKHQRLFNVFADFMITKVHRRYAQLRSNYRMRPVFREIARRFGTTETRARFMLTREYRKLLVDSEFDLNLLAEREKFCVLYAEEGAEAVFTGSEAAALAQKTVQKIDLDAGEIRGQCACMGRAVGKVKIILSPEDMGKMNPGDVLVAIATNPDVVPAMKKASAIVTEQGGVTCHAAIVSRELGIPCVIGTKIATKVLRDGETVEVDAGKGVVRRLKRQSLPK